MKKIAALKTLHIKSDEVLMKRTEQLILRFLQLLVPGWGRRDGEGGLLQKTRLFFLTSRYFLLSLSRVPTWRTNCDQRLLSESFFRFSIEKAQVTVCWQQCLKAETAFQIETILRSTFGDFKIKWFARAEVLISAFVEYFLFRDNEKATDGDGDSAAVWPDWAIFKVLGDNFSYKSSANIRLLFGLLWKIPF